MYTLNKKVCIETITFYYNLFPYNHDLQNFTTHSSFDKTKD
jgi:hypothetical protein